MNKIKFESTTSFFTKTIAKLLSCSKGDHAWLKSVGNMVLSKMNQDIIFEDLILFKKQTKRGNVLDFGTGSGYMGLLLANDGFNVKAIDVNNYDEYKKNNYNLLMSQDQKRLWKQLTNSTKDLSFNHYKNTLPFKDNSFEGVCAYAVLEHIPVKKVPGVLKEIHRVLKPGGTFYVSRLPRKLGISEYIAKFLRLGGHEKLYWDREILNLLINSKFNIIEKSYEEVLPAYPESITNYFHPFLKICNKILSMTPLKFFSHHLRLISMANKFSTLDNRHIPVIKKNFLHLISLLFILSVSLFITFTNLGTTKEIIGDDAGVSYHYPSIQLELASNTWDSYTFPGRSNVIATISLIHIGSVNVLDKIGLTPIVTDRLGYFLFFFISGSGLYFLAYNICRRLFSENKVILWVASLTGALLYILNNFTMILLSFPPTTYLYSYILLPWIFLLFYKGFHIDNNLWKSIIFAFTFLLILSGNPSNTVSIVILLLFFDFFLEKEKRIIRHWKNFSLTLVLILLLSSFMLLPLLGNNANPYGQVLGNDASIAYSSSNTSIDNLLRLLGHPAQNSYIFNEFLIRNRSIIINYLLLLLSLGFLLKRKISKIEIFFFLTFLFALFLAKAEHSPFSSINHWIYSNIPFFEMYRASYFKFVFFSVFSLSILLSIGLLFINEKVSKLRLPLFVKILVGVLPLLVVIYSTAPFFSGKVVLDIHKTTIPAEYHRANQYFSNLKTDFSVLSLPQLPSGLTLDWGNGNYYGSGANPDPYLLGRPVWTSGWFSSGNPTSNEFGFYKNFLGRTDVKYIFLHKDIPENYYFKVGIKGSPKGQTNYKLLDGQISKDSDFTLIEDNKYFKIFEIKEEKYKSHFEIPTGVIVSNKRAEDLLKVNLAEDWPKGSAVYFKEQNLGKDNFLDVLKTINTAESHPTLEYNKINSTKYRLKIHAASKQFPLIFNESFQDGWKLYLVKSREQNDSLGSDSITETWFTKPATSNNSHLMVNSYANSWIIDPKDLCAGSDKCIQNADGSYDMDLVVEFWPQRLFYLGLGISGLTLLYCFGQLAYSLMIRRKRIFRTKNEK